MAEVRAQIDQLDEQIVDLLSERAGYVRQAARIKARREEIVDPPRIEDVVAKVRARGARGGLPAELIEPLYRQLIDRFIALETQEHERLHDLADK
jgi:isochorismate pyruvate lyase